MKLLVILFLVKSIAVAQESSKFNKIVGGQIAEPYSIPHQVAILIKKKNDDYILCGGSLLNEKTILTAAHCLKNSDGALVIIGGHDLTKNETGTEKQFVKSSSYRIHPQFNILLANLDIALVFLPNPVNFTKAIQPVKLPSGFQLEESFSDEIGTVSGFGQHCDDCGSSQFLRFTENRVMSENECAEYFGVGTIPSETQLCLSTMETKSSNCRGDSGGPVTIVS
jgi:trypsin